MDNIIEVLKGTIERLGIVEKLVSKGTGGGLPDQTGNSGKFLTTDGTDPSWADVGSNSFVSNETPSGTINGTNATFTLTYTPVAGTLALYRDGQLMKGGGADYTLTGNSIVFVTAPATGSVLLAFYQQSVVVSGNADTLDGQHLSGILSLVYPVGAIYMSVVNTSPATLFGGTWVAWGSGRVPVGVDTGQTEFDTVEETGGAKTHTLSVDEMPSHTHSVWAFSSASGSYWCRNQNSGGYQSNGGIDWGYYNGLAIATGGGLAHNNLQPYITCYMWKRTA